MPLSSASFVKTLFSIISLSKNLIHVFLLRLLAKRQFSDGLRSWRIRPAMHQVEVVGELVEIVGLFRSLTVGISPL